VKDYRKIRNDHTFSYANKFYLIESPLKHSIAKQKIEIRTDHTEGFTAYFAGRQLTVSEVVEPNKPSMFDLDIQKKLDVLELAEKLDNVSEAARISGVSRDTIYRHRKLIREGGVQALKKQVRADHIHQNRTDQEVADTVIEFSLDNPHLGQVQVSNHLKKHYQIELSASGVRNVWLRENMQTCALRLQRKASMPASI
jgi:transposase